MRKPAITLGTLCLVAAISIGAVQAGNEADKQDKVKPLSRAEVSKPIAGAPATLAALHERVSELDEGGVKAFDAQLRALRGYPVVVNAWASWCDPCEFELPFFQRQALTRGKQVAFLGVNYRDDKSRAQELASRYPLPYPSFRDRNDVIERYKARGLPVTVFYDASGKQQFVHQGVFASEKDLSEAIERYAVK